MNFNNHSKLKGQHALLGASRYHWLNYDYDKLVHFYQTYRAAQHGTELHEFAATCIRLGQKLPKSRKTLNMYVNDAVGFKMSPEQTLYFSDNCFGTADAISFRDNILRIHDYKSGETPAHMEQLQIYAALFCLEYHYSPFDINIELRIYQLNDVIVMNPDPDIIMEIMDKIKTFDKTLQELKLQEAGS